MQHSSEFGSDVVMSHQRHRRQSLVDHLSGEIHQSNGERIPENCHAERVCVIRNDLDVDAELTTFAAGNAITLAQ